MFFCLITNLQYLGTFFNRGTDKSSKKPQSMNVSSVPGSNFN